ncbi:MAG: tetratricopeptide repeat protein [Gemmatimonadota bacterium]|nr:tetratricopeptide repeat protein [Gemmatimonadota bacterium]
MANTFWNKILGGSGKAEDVDYYEEGVALGREGRYHDALTSLRLALKESPGDPIVLQQIAIMYTRIGMEEEAVKTYRHVLSRNPGEPGAHYGLAFLLLRGGHQEEAVEHLTAFLDRPPVAASAARHVAYAHGALKDILGEDSRARARSSA